METSQSPFERYLTPIAVLLGAGLIALAVAYGGGGLGNTGTPATGQTYQEIIEGVSSDLGVNHDAIAALADEKAADYNTRIDASRDQGAELGVSGTPTIIMGNEVVAGLDPDLYSKIEAAIANPVVQPATALISKVTQEGEPFVGDANAPVTIAYYYDYQCGYCHQFMREVMPRLNDDFVKTGKLKIVLKDFQFLSPDSVVGALYGRALWEQDPAKHFAWFLAMGNLDAAH